MTVATGRVRAGALQVFAVLGGPLAWTGQHVVGYGTSEAACGKVGLPFGVSADAVEIAITAAAAAVTLAAEAAAVHLWLATRGVEESEAPPRGRVHFLGVSSIVVGVLFLTLIVIEGIGAVALPGCRQS